VTEEDIEAILLRVDNASKGAWNVFYGNKSCHVQTDSGRLLYLDQPLSFEDANFIASAKQDIPALCDEVARLWAEARRREAVVQGLREQLDAMPKPKCGCGNDGELPHECPYSEISGSNALCVCCIRCSHECAMDV
jgi:hypothetical protein